MRDLVGCKHRQVFCRLKTDSSIKDKAVCADTMLWKHDSEASGMTLSNILQQTTWDHIIVSLNC